MQTRTDPRTKQKIVKLEGWEARRLQEAVGILSLFEIEGVSEAVAASKAILAFLDKLLPKTLPLEKPK